MRRGWFDAQLVRSAWFGESSALDFYIVEVTDPPVASGVTATAAITLGAATTASTATVPSTATAAITLGAATTASTATVPSTATAAITLGACVASGAATVWDGDHRTTIMIFKRSQSCATLTRTNQRADMRRAMSSAAITYARSKARINRTQSKVNPWR